MADLAGYRLYRGSGASFTPSPLNLVASPVDTAYTDAVGMPFYYRITAVDVHGNESASTLLLPAGTLGVPGGPPPTQLAFAPPAPNPARAAASLRYALPRAAGVRLALYDASGRRVRLLLDGPQDAGERSVAWDLRDDAGHAVRAGLYLARFESGGLSLMRRVLVIR